MHPKGVLALSADISFVQVRKKSVANRGTPTSADGYLTPIRQNELFPGEGLYMVHIYQVAGVALDEPPVQLRLEVGKPPVNVDFLVLGNDFYLTKLLFKEQDVL